MDFRILGTIEVRDGDEPLPIGGGKQRALLALMLIHANEPIAIDRLIDELWPDEPPPTAAKIVQNYVSQLRRTLGDGVLETVRNGYVLHVGADELDSARFRRSLDEAKAALAEGDAELASRILRESFALWRGPPLADFTYEPFAVNEIERLEELRLSGRIAQVDAELASGRHAEVVGELEALVAQRPLHERLRAQLMLALYRSGRQAEALQVHQDARLTLAQELGIDPGEPLKALERGILAHDPALDPPAAPASVRAAKAIRRRFLAVAIAGLVVAAVGLAAAVAMWPGDDAHLTEFDANAVGVIDPRDNTLSGQVHVGLLPYALAVGGGSVYALCAGEGTVARIDAEELRLNATIPIVLNNASLTAIAFGHGAAWVADGNGRTLSRIYQTENHAVQPPVSYGRPRARDTPDLAIAGDSVWITNQSPPELVKVLVSELRPVARVATDVVPLAIAADRDAVWFSGFDPSTHGGVVGRLDTRQRRVALVVPLPDIPSGIAVAYGSVWVTVPSANLVWRIDPRTGSVTRTIEVGRGPAGIAAGEGAIWVTNVKGGTVSRIDPNRNRVVAEIHVGGSPRDVAVGNGRVWVGVL